MPLWRQQVTLMKAHLSLIVRFQGHKIPVSSLLFHLVSLSFYNEWGLGSSGTWVPLSTHSPSEINRKIAVPFGAI